MAFALANLAPAGNSAKPLSGVGTATLRGAPSLWTYATADAVNTVSASGYFNSVVALLNVGDLIFAACGAGSGGTLAPRIFVVVSNTGSVVDVADGTAVSVVDTY
jgi:hypothetical protein